MAEGRQAQGRRATAWDRIAKAREGAGREHPAATPCWKAAPASTRELFGIARTLVRAAEELPKPNGERLREFRDANLESLKLQLFSDEPIYDELRDRQADRQPDLPGRASWATTTRWCRRCWPASRRASGPPNWSTGTKLKDVEDAQEALRGRQEGDRRVARTR